MRGYDVKNMGAIAQRYARIQSGLSPYSTLFLRVGDFYEVFGSKAAQAASVLGIPVTLRDGCAMCGIPWHQKETAEPKLIRAGISPFFTDGE